MGLLRPICSTLSSEEVSVLRACYAVSGTEIAYAAGSDLGWAAMSGTDIAYGVLYWHSVQGNV
eukprot:3923183-Rhodomonas_salina.1